MKVVRMTAGAALVVWAMLYSAAHHQSPVYNFREHVVSAQTIYEDKQDATVMLYAAGAQGSGFFIAPNYIVTNAHVAEEVGTHVDIYHPERGMSVGVTIYSDRAADLAVVYTKVAGPDYYVLADYYPEMGQKVFNIGSPYGEVNTLAEGRVTGLGRIAIVGGRFQTHLLQFDVGIAPGASGSPIIDCNGKVVAIVSMRLVSPQYGCGPEAARYRKKLYAAVATHKAGN